MRIEQGVKIFRSNQHESEDLKENEIVIIEDYDNYHKEFFQLRVVENSNGRITSEHLKILRMEMFPNLKNPDLYYDAMYDCSDLKTAIEIAKLLNDDLRGGQ